MLRVDDPLGNGIRVNRPSGWLTDPAYWVQVGPQSPDRQSPFAWDGRDGGYGWIGPGSWSGLPVSWGGGDVASMVVPAVERCTGVIVNAVIRTDWRMVRTDGDGQVERRPLPLWVTDPMLLGSVPGALVSNTPAMNRLSATDFWTTFLTHAMWYGRGVLVGVEAADGGLVPGTLRLINPFLLQWDPTRGWLLGDPTRPVEVPFDGRFPLGDQTFRLVVMRGLGPNDGNLPEGILSRHWDTLGVGVDIRTYLSQSYLTGNQPSGFLKVTDPAFNEAKAEALKAKWTAAHGKSTRSVAVLNATVDYTPIQLAKVVDSAANEITHISRGDVALMFNLDPIWVGEGAGGLTYNNASDRRRDLVDLTASAWGAKLMDVLSSLQPYGTRIEIDWASFTTPLTTTAAAGQPAVQPAGDPAPSDPAG